MRGVILVVAAVMCLGGLPGCLGRFAQNQGRRQAARSADHYARKYGEPVFDDDPAFRQSRNDIADTIVRSGNERQKNRVGVNDRGYLTNEGPVTY